MSKRKRLLNTLEVIQRDLKTNTAKCYVSTVRETIKNDVEKNLKNIDRVFKIIQLDLNENRNHIDLNSYASRELAQTIYITYMTVFYFVGCAYE